MVLQDHVLQRAFTLESIHAVAASADGCFVAGGGASGTIYIWSTASGQLLRSWPAHYKVCLPDPLSAAELTALWRM